MLTSIKIFSLVLIVASGYTKFDSENFVPFTLEDQGDFNGTLIASSILVLVF